MICTKLCFDIRVPKAFACQVSGFSNAKRFETIQSHANWIPTGQKLSLKDVALSHCLESSLCHRV